MFQWGKLPRVQAVGFYIVGTSFEVIMSIQERLSSPSAVADMRTGRSGVPPPEVPDLLPGQRCQRQLSQFVIHSLLYDTVVVISGREYLKRYRTISHQLQTGSVAGEARTSVELNRDLTASRRTSGFLPRYCLPTS